jgi:glycosyltransferase involved in cell wall biosynthesis
MESSIGKVSIMMPVYNGEKYIESAIQTILDQTYKDWELVIVNDGSTDKTSEILEKIQDNRVKIIYQMNQGEAVARNTALQWMNGEFLSFLDSDDMYFPEFLESMVNFLLNSTEVDACYCDGWYIDTEDQILSPLSSQRRGPFNGDIFEPLIRASDVFGPPTCTLIRRKIIDQHRIQFDPRIVIGPDWDFFIKVAQFTNWKYLNIKGVKYRVHQTNITLTTSSSKRRESLAICRENAILNTRFQNCSEDVKYYVFYDLLVNILFDQPERQNIWLQSEIFKLLPSKEKAKLLRLSAAEIISGKRAAPYANKWLSESLSLNHYDIKTIFISFLNRFFPNICQKILFTRHNSLQSANNSPFSISTK